MSKRRTPPRAREPRRPHAISTPAPADPARTWVILSAMVAAYSVVYGGIVFIKFRYYLYADFDLAIFVQATDQILRGSLYSSIRGMNWLGDHVSLILFVIAPLYALVRHPLTLLFIQCLALALGALPVFALARRRLEHDGLALVCAGLYLLHPALGYTNLYEFHPEVLATSSLIATFWAIEARRFGWMLGFATLSLLCREDVALVVMMMGLWTLLPGRPRHYALVLLGLAAASLVVSFAVIRPRFASAAVDYARMYEEWGASVGEIALNILRQPLRALGAFFSNPADPTDTLIKRLYWPHMLGPLLFLPLLSPLTLAVALPVLAEHFLSSRPQQHWLLFQYTALVTPVMTVAGVFGFANLVRWIGRAATPAAALRLPGPARRVAIGVAGTALAASLLCNLLYGPILRRDWIWAPTLPEQNWPTPFDRDQRGYRDRMIDRVPATGGVVANFEFLARLAARPEVHSIHHIYTGFYTFSPQRYPTPSGIAALLSDLGDERLAIYVSPGTPKRLRDLVAGNDLRPVDAAGDLVLFLRSPADTVELVHAGAPPAPVARRVTYDRQLAFTGFSLPESTVVSGAALTLETYWQRVAAPDRQFILQLVLLRPDGRAAFSVTRHLGYLVYPVSEWPLDTTVRETYRLVVPAGVEPGTYTLGIRVAWWQTNKPALSVPDDPGLAAKNLVVELGRFTVTGRSPR